MRCALSPVSSACQSRLRAAGATRTSLDCVRVSPSRSRRFCDAVHARGAHFQVVRAMSCFMHAPPDLRADTGWATQTCKRWLARCGPLSTAAQHLTPLCSRVLIGLHQRVKCAACPGGARSQWSMSCSVACTHAASNVSNGTAAAHCLRHIRGVDKEHNNGDLLVSACAALCWGVLCRPAIAAAAALPDVLSAEHVNLMLLTSQGRRQGCTYLLPAQRLDGLLGGSHQAPPQAYSTRASELPRISAPTRSMLL